VLLKTKRLALLIWPSVPAPVRIRLQAIKARLQLLIRTDDSRLPCFSAPQQNSHDAAAAER
jgi:hypothetical protein